MPELVAGTGITVTTVGSDVIVANSNPYAVAQTGRAVTGTTDTPTTADVGMIITLSNAAAITVTVSGSLDLALWQRIDFIQIGAGQVTFVGSGATVNGTPGLKLRAQWSAATLICTGTDAYVLVGDLSA